MSDHLVSVAVPVPMPQAFCYRAPRDCLPGHRVKVGFGRRTLVGVVVEVVKKPPPGVSTIKPVKAVLGDAPLLTDSAMDLLNWCARYYHHPVGEVYAAALPASLRQGQVLPEPERAWRLLDDAPSPAANASRQHVLLDALRAAGGMATADALPAIAGRAAVLRSLLERGMVERCEAAATPPVATTPAPTLNAEQHAAAQAIGQAVAAGDFAAFLLDGVTGSGKTEVYCAALQSLVAAGQQALVLAPEIGLIPQLITRLRQRFAARVETLHSGQTNAERARVWADARRGDISILVGTRSAVFTPLPKLALIVVDESHDTAYKQGDGFRYNARDVALRRGQLMGVPVVLGSATPSLESLHNAQQGRYTHLRLRQRAGAAQLPKIDLLDTTNLQLFDGLSEPIISAIEQVLKQGAQALVFINRRGYAPTVLCSSCDWVASCGRCSAHMTLHRQRRELRCHHCGRTARAPAQCPDCGSDDLGAAGAGTQRVEAQLRKRFPGIGMARIDRDSTRRSGALEAALADAASGKAQLLVGTQMLAKGHDFAGLALVAVADGDQGLFGADFRAPEHMAQTILQVAGRAGRGARAGRVVIQTSHPEHPLLQRLASGDYGRFASAALDERREAAFPPYGFQALLRAESVDAQAAPAFLKRAHDAARAIAAAGIEVWAPNPAPMERKAGRWRWQLQIEAKQRGPLHALLGELLPQLYADPQARRVRWSVDIDPQSMI
ncbi:primosomal protein N' [bacterium]|nr:primosomal protein N' [bacterium]